MKKHILIDNLTISIANVLIGKNKFFSESAEGPSLQEHLDSINLDVSEVDTNGIYEVKSQTLVGELDPAFKIVQWKGEEYPLLIFHHGSNERPFQSGRFAKSALNRIFMQSKHPIDLNLIALRAPFHNNSTRHYQRNVTKLSNFTAMLAVSVKLAEYVVNSYKESVRGAIVLSGISLGGWVTNIHRAFFNTADKYIPIMAGANVSAVFIDSVYRKLTGKNALKNTDSIDRVLNFVKEFENIQDNNVFPLLARYDQYIQYDIQKSCYGNRPIKTIENGHVTGALNSQALLNHILQVMEMKNP